MIMVYLGIGGVMCSWVFRRLVALGFDKLIIGMYGLNSWNLYLFIISMIFILLWPVIIFMVLFIDILNYFKRG